MTTPPTIVVLEDERPQLLAVRAALRGLGEIRDFADPHPALDFLKNHTADAAIVDIHMPRFDFDGMSFLRSVREFDPDLCVIIRTGDDSSELADGAIEVRAFRRALKGRTTVDELRNLTTAAVLETRARRQLTADAASTAAVKTDWTKTLGSVEEATSVAGSYQALFQTMRNRLTALAGLATVLKEAAGRGQSVILDQCAAKNQAILADVLTDVNGFLDGPFAATEHSVRTDRRITANRLLDSLQKHFGASPKWTAERRALSVTGLGQNLFVSAAPLSLLTAMRHLVEFCLERSVPGSTVQLTAHCIEDARAAIASSRDPKLAFTNRPLSGARVCLLFQVSGRLGETSLEFIRRAFEEHPDDPRSGNLQMIPLALSSDLLALVVRRVASGAMVFDLYIPVGR